LRKEKKMDNLLLYLVKVSAGTTMLYLCYLLLFRKDTFYLRNRILLILILILPVFFPFIKIPVVKSNIVFADPVNTTANFDFSGTSAVSAFPGASDSFDYIRIFTVIYFVVTALLMIRILISLISTYRIIRQGTINRSHFPKVIISENQISPFSFFPYAVIPAEDFRSGNYNDVLDHEFAHLRQGHSFDLLLTELFISFQWFNPFVWLIKRSVILNHEYLADQVSLINNKSAKEYQYRLLNFQKGLKNISLAHNFNSLIKNRIIMINKKPTRKYATLKNILILPAVAIVVYAFSTPEYHSSVASSKDKSLSIYQQAAVLQKEVKGKVVKEDGKPLEGVNITSTGTLGNAQMTSTGSDGRFAISNAVKDAILIFNCRGYKQLLLKSDINKEMIVKMENDPDYKSPAGTDPDTFSGKRSEPIVIIDGVITEKNSRDAIKDLGYNMGISKLIYGKEATDKYGDKAVPGAWEITTRKKALEMGLKPPYPRLAPDDYPTFQNKRYDNFTEWVGSQIKYPAAAQTKKQEGWVALNFNVELNGTISNIVSTIPVDPILSDEVIRVVKSSPKWDAPKNRNVDEPFASSVTLKFKLPDRVLTEAPFVVVEQMPMYPGGDGELLKFLKNNTKYPEPAKANKIQGRVIIRFIVSTEGKAEGVSVLKGVDPQLDAEAIRVTSMVNGFKPGLQGGKAVGVWYMVPINFSLATPQPLFSQSSQSEILKFMGMNTGYPQAARSAADTGMIFIVVKMGKGGVVKECKAYTEKTEIKVPFLPEVVIVGYQTQTPGSGDIRPGNATGNPHTDLQTEGLRIANKLGGLDIPEWKDKDMEFALTLKFVLKEEKR
jgi:TonB family protein